MQQIVNYFFRRKNCDYCIDNPHPKLPYLFCYCLLIVCCMAAKQVEQMPTENRQIKNVKDAFF